jgi:hypothetical protein
MEELWKYKIVLEYPIISCEGNEFYSLKEAANHFKLSSERIRQKINDDSHPTYIYLY